MEEYCRRRNIANECHLFQNSPACLCWLSFYRILFTATGKFSGETLRSVGLLFCNTSSSDLVMSFALSHLPTPLSV